jgi:hypothetical protein
MLRRVVLHVVLTIPEGIVATVKHSCRYVIIWVAISWYSVSPIITLSDRINASDYVDILANRLLPVVQMFRNNDANFHDDNSPTYQPEVFSLGLRILKMHFNIFPFYSKCQATVCIYLCMYIYKYIATEGNVVFRSNKSDESSSWNIHLFENNLYSDGIPLL